MRTARLAACLGLGLSGCAPNDYPPWLIDHPLAWGIVASVVQPGPYSSAIEVPADRVRASALPLDTLELQALVVAPPDTPPLPPPIWIACVGYTCRFNLYSESELPPACPSPLPLSESKPCRLGEGERVRLTLGGAFSAGPEFSGTIDLLVVGSGDPDLSPETCLERLASIPRDELQRCLIQARYLELGPSWAVLAFAPDLVQQHLVDIPADWSDEPPDVHPVFLHFDVLRLGAGGLVEIQARDGDSVIVRPGERLILDPIFADDAPQPYYRPVRVADAPDLYRLEPDEERMGWRFAFTELVEDAEGDILNSFTVPDVAGPIVVHFYATDSRQGRATASLRLVVERPGDAP